METNEVKDKVRKYLQRSNITKYPLEEEGHWSVRYTEEDCCIIDFKLEVVKGKFVDVVAYAVQKWYFDGADSARRFPNDERIEKVNIIKLKETGLAKVIES